MATSDNKALRCVVWAASLALTAGLLVAGEPAKPKQGGDYRLPDLTVTGRNAAVELGERSIFTGLLPRDLFQRPQTESPGLDTATTVIGAEQIRWLDAFSVVDAMKYTPGGWTESRGRKVKDFFSVRGQRYPYPSYCIDGAWFREFHETNYYMSAANLDRIELVRSAGELLLSPGGLTGVVNVVPRTYKEAHTQLDTVFGSDTTLRTQFSHGGVFRDISYAFGAGFFHTAGDHNENAEENMTNLYGRIVSRQIPELTLSLTAFTLFGDRELRLAEPPASKTHRTREQSFDPMHTYVVVGKARYEASDRAATELTVNYGSRRFHGHQVGNPRWLEEDYEYGARLMQTLRLSEANTLRLGGMFNHWVSPTGKRFYVGRRGDLWTWSGVVVDEHRFGRLLVSGGYRLSRTFFDQFGGINVEGSPSGGLASVEIDDEWEDPLHTLTLGASYALTEQLSLHGNFVWGQIAATPGMLDATLGRPGTETRTKLDFGIKRAWESFGEIDLTAFCVRQQDAALTMPKTTVDIDGEPHALYQNADRRSYGLELDIRTRRFASGLQLFFNAVAMKTRDDRTGDWERDQEVPEVILGGGVSYLVGDLELAVLGKRVGTYENERFLPKGSDPANLGDYTEWNAKLTYFFGKEKEHNVFVGVDNIADRKYSVVNGYPDDGRRFKLGLSLSF